MSQSVSERLLTECRGYRGGRPSDALRAATGAFLEAARKDRALLASVTGALDALEPGGVAWVAITLGSAVEQGADASETGPLLWRAFARWVDELAPAAAPGATSAAAGSRAAREAMVDALPMFAQSVVAHLARLPALREELGRDRSLIERLERIEEDSFAARWVREALERASGRLVLIHPTTATGVELRYENVGNCFHLFSLVQCAVGAKLPDGREPDPSVLAAVTGASNDRASDWAWWHYGDPGSREPQVRATIWGEANVRSVPTVDGVQVILLWPRLVGSRGWDSSFFGPVLDAMPARATVERELSADEVRGWFAKLGLGASSVQ